MNMKTTHIFLAGGGDAKDSELLDKKFVKMLDLTKPLVYIPNAMRSKPYQSCLEWFHSVMTPLGVTSIKMWDDLHPRYQVDSIAGVYIGGGDTVKLLKEVRETGFDGYLNEVIQRGVPLYGGSAGAIILGEDIRTAPEARDLSASEATGLKITEGYSIICHYKTDNEETVQNLSKNLHQSIIAISEKAGGYITRKKLTNHGIEPLAIIREDRINLINPNHSTELKV